MYSQDENIYIANNATLPLEDLTSHFIENQCLAEKISLEQKIASMIMMGFEGTSPSDIIVQQIIQYIEEGRLGGVILYGYNIVSPEQLKVLTKALHHANPNILVATDQEGGQVQRLNPEKGFTGFPSAFEVAAHHTLDHAQQIYDNLAKELFDNGINLNLAPVVDIHKEHSIIGSRGRSYGEEIETIVNYAEKFIDSHHKYKIFTALKHFPGHGLAVGDTHKGMVDVTGIAEERELEPFNKLISAQVVDMIMTAHVINKHIDSKYPATLSPIVMQQLLRDKGYNGIIITDDLMMGAIVEEYSLPESIILSINAGSDILLVSNNILACKGISDCKTNYDLPHTIFKIVKEAIDQDKITLSRINDAYNRIMALKNRFIH